MNILYLFTLSVFTVVKSN